MSLFIQKNKNKYLEIIKNDSIYKYKRITVKTRLQEGG